MAESFLETLARVRQPKAAPVVEAAPLPTEYGQIDVPQGRLIDADTLETPTGERVRLAGQNAPELQAPDKTPIPAGQDAYARAAGLFQQYPDAKLQRSGTDIHGRTVGTFVAPDGTDLAGEAVRQGIAPTTDWNRSGADPYREQARQHLEQTLPQDTALGTFYGHKTSGKIPVAPKQNPKNRSYGEELGAAVARGTDSAQEGVYGAMALVGEAVGDKTRGGDPLTWKKDDPRLTLRDKISNWLQRTGNTGAMRNAEEAAQNPAAYSFKDVQEGKADLLQWGLGVLGEALPSTALLGAAAAVSGGAGALAGRLAARGVAGAAVRDLTVKAAEDAVTGAIRRKLIADGVGGATAHQIARSIAADPVKHAAATYAKRAAFAGAWAGSSALEGGHMYLEGKKEFGPQADWRHAAAGGLAAGLLDTGALAVMAAPLMGAFATRQAAASLATVAGNTLPEKLASLAGGILKGAGMGIAAEGPTEAAQELIAIASVEAQRESDVPLIDRLNTPEYRQRILEAGVAGAVFGGVFGGAGGAAHGARSGSSAGAEATPATDPALAPAPPPTAGESEATAPGISPAPAPAPSTAPPAAASPAAEPPPAPPSTASLAQAPALDPAQAPALDPAEAPADPRPQAPPVSDPLSTPSSDPLASVDISNTNTNTADALDQPIRLRRGQSIELRPQPPVKRSESTPEQQARLAEKLGVRPIRQPENTDGQMQAQGQARQAAPEVSATAPEAPRGVKAPPPETPIEDTKNAPDTTAPAPLGETEREQPTAPDSDKTAAPAPGGPQAAKTPAAPFRVLNERGAPEPEKAPRGPTEEDLAKYRKTVAALKARDEKAAEPVAADRTAAEKAEAARQFWENWGPLGDETPEPAAKRAQQKLAIAPPSAEDIAKYGKVGAMIRAQKRAGVSSPAPSSGWARTAPEGKGYEVSSEGDSRFSALNAKLKDGRTIEEAYQLDVKGYRRQSDDWRAGKGKPPLREMAPEALWTEYKKLWSQWADENPALIRSLREKSAGRVLTDRFATTPVSQARALAEIIAESVTAPAPSAAGAAARSPGTAMAVPAPAPTHSGPASAPASDAAARPRPSPQQLPGEAGSTAPQTPRTRGQSSGKASVESPGSDQKKPDRRLSIDGEAGKPDVSVDAVRERAPTLAAPARERTLDKALFGPERTYMVEAFDPAVKRETAPVERPASPEARKGRAQASRIATVWRKTLGIESSAEIALPDAHAQALAGSDAVRRHAAAHRLAREVAGELIDQHWGRAGAAAQEQIKKAWKMWQGRVLKEGRAGNMTAERLMEAKRSGRHAGARDPQSLARYFDGRAWLADEVAEVLLHDAKVRQYYAERNLPLVYRWLRNVGAALRRLADEAAKVAGFKVKGADESVARWVHSLIDARRAEMAERRGFSPALTARLGAATNALAEGESLADELPGLERGLAESNADPLYRNWLKTLKVADAQLSKVPESIRALAQDALRELHRRAVPQWQRPEPMAPRDYRSWQRRQLYDAAPALALLERDSPETAGAVRDAVTAALLAEDALHRAGSLAQIAQELTPSEQPDPAGEALALLAETQESRLADRAAARAFAEALGRPDKAAALAAFDAATKGLPETVSRQRLRLWLAGEFEALAADMAEAGGAAVDRHELAARWAALGLALDDLPPLVPPGERWANVGVAASENLAEGVADYAARARLFEQLPAAHRDALAEAYRRAKTGESLEGWLAFETARALASDPVPYRVLQNLAARDDPRRPTYDRLLAEALAAEDKADPAVVEALRYRMRARYGKDALADAERLLGGASQGRLAAWYLLAQGYRGGQFDQARARETRRLLRSARTLLELTPGMDTAGVAGQAAFLARNLPGLSDALAELSALTGREQTPMLAARQLVEWRATLDAEQAEDELVEETGDERPATEDEDAWMAEEIEAGIDIERDSDGLREQKEDASERAVALTHQIALLTDYSPRKSEHRYGAPQLKRRFAVLAAESELEGSLLESHAVTSIDPGVPLDAASGKSEPFEADLDHGTFKRLPAEVQHALLRRAQVLGRIGVRPEYRVARHKTRDGREVHYIEEYAVLSDLAVMQGAAMSDRGGKADVLAIDFAAAELEKSRQQVAQWSLAAKNEGAVEFEVRAALDHPLLARLARAIERAIPAEELAELREDWRLTPPEADPAVAEQLKGRMDDIRAAIGADPGLHALFVREDRAFAQLAVAALGWDEKVFHGGRADAAEMENPNLRPGARKTAPAAVVVPDAAYAKELGLAPVAKKAGGSYRPIEILKSGGAEAALEAFARMFVAGFDPKTNTVKTGETAQVSADALVRIGLKSLTGAGGSPNVHHDRLDAFYRGLDIAAQQGAPWVAADPAWRTWDGRDAKALNERQRELVLTRRKDGGSIRVGGVLEWRNHPQQLQQEMSDLDSKIQALHERADALMRQHALQPADMLTGQARNEAGRKLQSFEGVMPEDVLRRAREGAPDRRAMPWLRRFGPQQERMQTVEIDGVRYTARPWTGIEELTHVHARIGRVRRDIGELRARLKNGALTGQKRGLGGSELNYFATAEEELARFEAWVDALGVGNNAARINPEQRLFDPGLRPRSEQIDLEAQSREREGLQSLRAPSRRADPEDRKIAPTTTRIGLSGPLLRSYGAAPEGAITEFLRSAIAALNLANEDIQVHHIDLEALGKPGGKSFGDTMADLGLLSLAEDHWQNVLDEPFYTVFKDGVAHITVFNRKFDGEALVNVTADEMKHALAHELGHVFFRTYIDRNIERHGEKAEQLRALLDLKPSAPALAVEEAVAEVVRETLAGAPAPPGGLGALVARIKIGLQRLIGLAPKATLESLLDHISHRAAPRDATVFFSGRKLLESALETHKGAWGVLKDWNDALVRTAHSWLRAQRTAEGRPIAALQALADILRWTSGVAPATRAIGGQTFDFTSTDSDHRQSYEQAVSRRFARFGTRIESMLEGWVPLAERAKGWSPRKRQQMEEAARARQSQVVRDWTNGVKNARTRELERMFDDMGAYFGPVVKRFDPERKLPRIFNQEVLRARKADFLALLEASGTDPERAEQTFQALTREPGQDYREDATQFFAPKFARAKLDDALGQVQDKDLLPFLLIDTQPQAALWQYAHQMVKRTEFERRFGGWVYFEGAVDFNPQDLGRPNLVGPADAERLIEVRPERQDDGKAPQYYVEREGRRVRVLWDQTAKFRLLRAEAVKEGATVAQVNHLNRLMEAEMGRYGANYSPRLRNAQSALIAGMNWAVLPLSITAQFTDLALPVLRGNGDLKSAWRGMKQAFKSLREKDDLYAAAKANGVLAGNLREYFNSAYLDTPFIASWAQKWNSRLFRINGMETATEFVRMYAFATGKEWIKSLADKKTAEADAQLEQLGLSRADVEAWRAVGEALDTGGAVDPTAERVQQALNTFVEQSMFRPSASQRPVWASHPAAQLVWYLKSYTWSYAEVILGRTWREFQRADSYGQKALIASLPFLLMLPLAALGLGLRDELRDQIELPWRKPKRAKEDDGMDQFLRLLGRTGVMGPMQVLIDAERASEYGSPYYLSLIGPFATMTDQILSGISRADGAGAKTKAVADGLLRMTPIVGVLPQERRSLLDWALK